MAEMLWRWQKHLQWDLSVAHVHHGYGDNNKQNMFRDRAADKVAKLAQERGLEFLTNPAAPTQNQSESAFRDCRLHWLNLWFKEGKFDFVAFAHHRDDLLETRILRLLRGTGTQGLKSMSRVRSRVLRPLLDLSRSEVMEYARERKLSWVEDPSNTDVDPLRNWIRSQWLPQLEKRQAGATKAMSRSLDLLSEKVLPLKIGEFVGLRREALTKVEPQTGARAVARYFRSLGLRGYGQSHVQELLKRLNTRQKNFEFEMLGMRFHVTRDLVWASRV